MKKLIPRNICLLADAVSDFRDGRPNTTGVRVRLNESGYIAEATNGRILVRLEGEYTMPVEEFPHAIPDVKNDYGEAVIPTVPGLCSPPSTAPRGRASTFGRLI